MQDAEAGFTGDPQQAIEGIFAEGGVAALSRNGTLGDPARASAEHGERYWAAALEIVLQLVPAEGDKCLIEQGGVVAGIEDDVGAEGP